MKSDIECSIMLASDSAVFIDFCSYVCLVICNVYFTRDEMHCDLLFKDGGILHSPGSSSEI